MTSSVERHKQWRQKKKQSVEQLQVENQELSNYCDTLLEAVTSVNAQLKRFTPLLDVPDEKLNEIIMMSKPTLDEELRKKFDDN